METKKAITIGVVVVILMATAAVFAVKIARNNSSVSTPSPVQTAKPINKAQPKTGDSVQPATQADSDVASLESDLNSVSEEDFSDSSLSDSAVGL